MSEAHDEITTEERRPSPGLTNGADDDLDTATETPSWREDWRTALSQGDEKRAKQLERFGTPEAVAKAFFDTRERLSRATRAAPEPPEEATEVELREWRKAAGVPEDPTGYGIEFPKDLDASESDQAELAGFLNFMHERHIAPRAAKAAFDFYMTSRTAGAERAAQAAEEATLEHLAQLRASYPGREYKRNIGLANDYLNSHFSGPDNQKALDVILSARLPNGVQLTNYAPFVQAIVAMARQNASEDDLISGDAGGGAQSVDEEYKDLAAKPRLSDAERNRMVQLAEARIKREERAANR